MYERTDSTRSALRATLVAIESGVRGDHVQLMGRFSLQISSPINEYNGFFLRPLLNLVSDISLVRGKSQ